VSNYYPAKLPYWFTVYAVSSAYYDEVAAIWWQLVLGSVGGDKATFRQYLFRLGPPHTEATEAPIAITVVHAVFTLPVAGRLYIYCQSDRDVFWQDGPALAQTRLQQTVARVYRPAPPFRATSKEQHDFLPVRYPTIFEDEWKRWVA
jgi:hypothetical protein